MIGKIDTIIKDKFGISPKDFQRDTLSALLREQDIFLSTRTGGGKSMAFLWFPSVWSEMHDGELCSVLVVTPLFSIMKEQCEFLEERGYKASYIGRSEEGDAAIQAGILDFVFSSPENLLSVDR